MKQDPAKFIVQDTAYEQHYGYPLWCAHVLEKLVSQPPITARELIEQSAAYMHDKTDPAYQEIYQDACRHLKIVRKSEDFSSYIFGPASDDTFGKFCWGGITTPIGVKVPASSLKRRGAYRGYYEILETNQPEWMETDQAAPLAFSYPIAGTPRSLNLMQIGRDIDVLPDDHSIVQMYKKHLVSQPMLSGKPRMIYFRHPAVRGIYNDLIGCLEPLYQTILDTQSSQDQKSDSIIEFYWLIAQTTPVMRGGSAQSRILLEYLSSQAGIELPHLRSGCDLWAEAATSSLSQFREAFKQEVFFDPDLTSQEILAWQSRQLGTTSHAR